MRSGGNWEGKKKDAEGGGTFLDDAAQGLYPTG